MAGLGRRTFNAGEVLTAANVQNYLQDQAVMVFAGTAARASAIPTPSEGMVTYQTDTNQLTYYDGSNFQTIAYTASPTFTGTVTIPAGASISGYAPTASPTFTGTVTIPAGASISGYAPTADPTFTGTVNGGIISGVTSAAAGRGLLVRQPSGDGSAAILQFTNNAVTAQRASIDASSAGQLTATATTIYLSSTTAYWNAVYNTTVAGSANVLSSSDMQLRRATSSGKYKKDIEPLEHELADKILDLRPVWFRAKENNVDNPEQWSYVGLIAEEVAEVEPRLVFYKTVEVNYDENGNVITDEQGNPTYEILETPEPESVQYDKLAVYLLDIIKREKARSNDLEQRIITLEKLVKN